ncbi:hypothetical protein EXIGLDRAFT_670845 [Exidia glandulosa HHB12029]|uniref:Vesicle tethering protein Uso1/P115-like head domain-containing protein n=1 Tax=Exidia glandulosa HHB12029 TaxID=1314781 RepID=A0A166B073_EXIGL|nr:hypothetical protein EXIGLDRAFT_670845 [Exidia glandulosa HHB12029]
MDFFSQTYTAIRGPAAEPQTAVDTITKLADRLAQAPSIADRRASILALKGLARDMPGDVGSMALPALLAALPDASVDADLGKALLETLLVLCDAEPGPGREAALKHADAVLADPNAAQAVFSLLTDPAFYVRFSALQLLSTLLSHRRQAVQAHFLRTSDASSIISVLDEKREIIRNEVLSVIQVLIAQNADIQKIFAFGGAFEKLLGIVTQEGGIEGTVVVQESLACIDTLLRYNVSNQNYFREIGLVPSLCPLFLFPANFPDHIPAPQEFALQFWDIQKAANAQLVLGIVAMLVSSKGGASGDSSMVRFLVELGLASNAPTQLKLLALQSLPHLSPPLALQITPYVPVPETNGEEWDRLEARSALDVIVDIAINGEYSGTMPGPLDATNLGLRSAAVSVFENYARDEEVKLWMLQQLTPDAGGHPVAGAAATLLAGINSLPTSPLSRPAATRLHISTVLFASLVRSSSAAKTLARSIVPTAVPSSSLAGPGDTSSFFVPADNSSAPAQHQQQQQQDTPGDEDDETQTLLQALAEHLSLALLSRTRAVDEREAREWDRCIVGILSLLAQWLWDDPRAVKEVLEAGVLSTLVEPIGQDDVDAAVQGLCAFVLGILYEFDREPGEIPRTTIYPLIMRLGADMLASRMSRLREDERFRSAAPEGAMSVYPRHIAEAQDEGEMWFAWEFVEFWKSNYYTIQRGVHADPNTQRAADSTFPSPVTQCSLAERCLAANPEAATLIASLREVIQRQADDLDALRKASRAQKDELQTKMEGLEGAARKHDEERSTLLKKVEALEEAARSRDEERDALQAQVASLAQELESVQEKRREQEKEHEDLLVFLEELSAKRKRDKEALRAAGQEVSEDEDEGDGDEEE